MLEACISVRRSGTTTGKNRGDILAVALPGFEWGTQDRKVHQIVLLDDPDLESEVANTQRGIIELPYATYTTRDVDGKPVKELASRSAARIDIDALPARVKTEVFDTTKVVDPIPATTYKITRDVAYLGTLTRPLPPVTEVS